MKPLRLSSSRFRQPLVPASLRVLLLGALGSAVWACAGRTDECTAGHSPCDGDNNGAGGSTDGPSTGGTSAGGTPSDGGSTGGAANAGGGSSGGTGNTGGTSGAGGGGSGACSNPTPYVEGADTGIFRCDEGYLWRTAATQCPSNLPRTGYVDWPTGDAPFTISADECDQDVDCPENATCLLRNTFPNTGCLQEPPPSVPDYERVCWAGCREDGDCAANELCLCGADIGRCQAISPIAGCHDDADCDDGFLCLRNARTSPLSGLAFACQLPGDACTSDVDCAADSQYCRLNEGGRVCETQPVCGRPFLVAQEARIAAPVESAAWQKGDELLDLSRLEVPSDAELRQRLANHWTDIGLLEHASVAAFARFTLQLMSVGAPAELVQASQQAALDEIHHAELAFALASRYAGRDIGPGPLEMTGALDGGSVAEILRTTVREGCIGETQAALEASRAAEGCEDGIVRAILETIAADEARHAELAWRVVRYLVTTHPETASTLAEEFGAAERRARTARAPEVMLAAERSGVARHGVLEPAALEDCHRIAHREVIGPCASALIAGAVVQAA